MRNITIQGPAAHVLRNLVGFSGFSDSDSWHRSRRLFLRVLGLAYLASFAGWLLEGPAILGWRGLVPIGAALAPFAERGEAWASRLVHFPSLLWLSASDASILSVAGVGAVAAAALSLGFFSAVALAVCVIATLSLAVPAHILPTDPADALLGELGMIALFVAPRGPISALGTLALRALVARVVLEAGLATQHSAPYGAAEAVEAAMPVLGAVFSAGFFLSVVLGPRARAVWAALWSAAQIGLLVSGGELRLSLALLALALPLVDDGVWGRTKIVDGAARERSQPRLLRGFRRAAKAAKLAILAALMAAGLGRWSPAPALLVANDYGAIGLLPPVERELRIDGSNDGGKSWRHYWRGVSAVGPVQWRAPLRVSRVDGLLAAAASRFEAPLARDLALRLGAGLVDDDPAVSTLFSSRPFDEALEPPATRFRFLIDAIHAQSGRWRREEIGALAPSMVADGQGIHPE